METTVPRLKQQSLNRVMLNWTQLNALINGVSAIDQQSLAIRNRSDAERFAKEYGFNPEDPRDRAHIQAVHREALEFIKENFITEEQFAMIPKRVKEPEHELDLLVYSSNYLNKSNERQLWACALLKVMHGIFHIDHDFKLRYFDLIRDQIFESLDQVIIEEGERHLLKGIENVRIPLYFYQKKRNKGRSSILLKLLQKPRYVAADIYDHLGIRLVFETKAECLFAIQQLRKQHMISITNIKPFRSRNTLVDLKEAQSIFKKYRPLLDGKDEYPYRILNRMDEELDKFFDNKHDNPHSSDDYRSIQITARKMVRLPNPAYERVTQLLNALGDKVEIPSHLSDSMGLDKELIFYFDYEIQLLDRKSWLKTLDGPSSHQAYKARQIETARKRVLGGLTKILEERAIHLEGV